MAIMSPVREGLQWSELVSTKQPPASGFMVELTSFSSIRLHSYGMIGSYPVVVLNGFVGGFMLWLGGLIECAWESIGLLENFVVWCAWSECSKQSKDIKEQHFLQKNLWWACFRQFCSLVLAGGPIENNSRIIWPFYCFATHGLVPMAKPISTKANVQLLHRWWHGPFGPSHLPPVTMRPMFSFLLLGLLALRSGHQAKSLHSDRLSVFPRSTATTHIDQLTDLPSPVPAASAVQRPRSRNSDMPRERFEQPKRCEAAASLTTNMDVHPFVLIYVMFLHMYIYIYVSMYVYLQYGFQTWRSLSSLSGLDKFVNVAFRGDVLAFHASLSVSRSNLCGSSCACWDLRTYEQHTAYLCLFAAHPTSFSLSVWSPANIFKSSLIT